MTTTNLADFGNRELKMLGDLLIEMIEQGLPDDFEDIGVVPMMNYYSGNVFLTNDEYQVAMINPNSGRIESFYTLNYYGNEGFLKDLLSDFDNGNIKPEDYEDLATICEINHNELDAERIRQKWEEWQNED